MAYSDESSQLLKLRRLILGEETKAIIDYLRKNPNSTIDKVAKHLQQEKICSRLTSLSVIEKLLAIGLLKDERKGKYFHSLTYNEDFDFRGLASTILKRNVKDILNIFDRFVLVDSPKKDQLEYIFQQLDWYVEQAVNEHYKQIGFEEKEAISADGDSKSHKNMVKAKKKSVNL